MDVRGWMVDGGWKAAASRRRLEDVDGRRRLKEEGR